MINATPVSRINPADAREPFPAKDSASIVEIWILVHQWAQVWVALMNPSRSLSL
jgi:hypothetical protein